MDNPRPEKVAVVAEVRERFNTASAAILTEYRGLSVKDIATLRRSLTEVGGTYKIYKNTLVGFAARDLGLTELESMLHGPTGIAFVERDAVDVAKALRDFARTHPNLVVKGGLLGDSVLSSADAAALADLPPRNVLLARLAGALAAPMIQFAGLLQALPRNLAYGIKALIEEKGGVPDTSDDTAAPESAAPESAAPESAAPESAAPESAAPESAAPESASPESAAPESAAPEVPAEPADPEPAAPASAEASDDSPSVPPTTTEPA